MMSRELNPQLFNTFPGSSIGEGKPGGASMRYEVPPTRPEHRVEPGRPVPFPALDLKLVEAQVAQMRSILQQFDQRLDQLNARLGELARDTNGRLEQYGNQVLRVEDGLNRLTRDSAERFAMIVAKVNERKLQDSKIQDMVDRHNLMVRNFENRLEAVQKLASDQEQALLSAFAALEDARADLARLKRL